MPHKEINPETWQKLEESQFYDSNIVHFVEVMRWQRDQTITAWGEKLLNELTPFMRGLQSALYKADYHTEILEFVAGYALQKPTQASLVFGDGLVGQSAKSKEIILLDDLPTHFFSFHISTMEIKPSALVIIPLLYNQRVRGVLEMIFLKKPEEKYIKFLKKISYDIGSNLNALNKDQQLRHSLLQVQESKERLLKLSEVTQEGITFIQNGRISECNSAFENMFGYTPEQPKDKAIIDFIAGENPQSLVEQAAETPTEAFGMRLDGSLFPLEIESRKVEYQEQWYRVITFRDISKQKEAERMISQQEEELAEAHRIMELYKIIEQKNKNILASINYAKRIQQAILPKLETIRQAFPESFVFYLPKDVVSGDFYWFAENESYYFITAVDCTGHGVPGAFMSLIGYMVLDKVVKEKKWEKPRTILTHLNVEVTKLLRQDPNEQNHYKNRDGMDIVFCSIQKDFSQLYYAGANRPLILQRNEGDIEQIKGNPFPIGGSFRYKKGKKFTQHLIPLQKGDTIYLTTDGFADQINAEGKKYMTKRFRRFLHKIQVQPMSIQLQTLENELKIWQDTKRQVDDVLVIGVRF